MSLISMTGFGRGVFTDSDWRISVEISTVNRKQFDLRINLPRELSALEAEITRRIHQRIFRGSVNAVIHISPVNAGGVEKVEVDTGLAREYLKAIKRLSSSLNIENDIGMRDLMALPDIIKKETRGVDAESVLPILLRALNKALVELDIMRKAEGAVLQKDLEKRLTKLTGLKQRIAGSAGRLPTQLRKRLAERLAAAGIETAQADPVFAREIAYMADRSDITEELVRLDSHFKQASALMHKREPVGRALDFVCQELFREINTIGSKTADAAIMRNVIAFKSLLETFREQVQNVE